MKRILVLGLTVLLGLGGGQAALAAEFNWRFFTFVPPTDFNAKMNKEFAEDITAASGGRLEISHFAAGELPYKAGDVIKAIATNQIQMGQVSTGLTGGDAPELDIFTLPFLCTTFEGFAAAAEAIGDIPDQILTKKFGVRVLMNWPLPGQNIWSSEKIATITDLKGKKIRTWNPLQVEMLQTLGGSPISLDPAEVTQALQRGVANGAITSALSANDWKVYDIVRYGFMLNFSMSHQLLLVNQDALAELPDDLRKLVEDKVREWTPRYFKASEAANKAALENMTKNGVELTEASAEEIANVKAALRPIWGRWASANGPVAADLLERTSKACQ